MKKEKTALNEDATKAIQEEIRTKVFERYAEMQGVQTQELELKATLDALHEITHIPLADIENIASEVMQKYGGTQENTPLLSEKFDPLVLSKDFTFERLLERVKRKKRGFMSHLIAYSCVGVLLIFLNVTSTSFPWAIFPLLGWGIGIANHYFAAVRWPTEDLKNKIQLIKNQMHHILQENVPIYRTSDQTKIFNGMYRLLVAESSQETMNVYLKRVDPNMADNQIYQATVQLCSLRDKYLS